MTDKPYILYGMAASLYTAKVRAYLRQQKIGFIERPAGDVEFRERIVPRIGRWIIPAVETPDGQIIQDGTDIIDHFENGPLARNSVYPKRPILRAIAHLFELFGGEGLLRPAMHYRWNFDDSNLAFLRSAFQDVFPAGLTAEQASQMFDMSSGRMRAAGTAFGVTPDNFSVIEESYKDFLNRLNAHFTMTPFLLGGSPTIGDYGLLGPLYPHLGRDPYPAMLMKQIAPMVYRWTERMNAPEYILDHVAGGEDVFAGEAIPQTLKSLMHYIALEFLPEITAHVAFANHWLAQHPDLKPGTNGLDDPAARGIGMAEFIWRGRTMKSVVMPYRFYLLQRLQDMFDNCGDDDRHQIRTLFTETGLSAIFALKTARRVERNNHLEIWGDAT